MAQAITQLHNFQKTCERLQEQYCCLPSGRVYWWNSHWDRCPIWKPCRQFDPEKGFSLPLCGVVGGSGTFMDPAIGYPGNMHDARFLRSSELFWRAERRKILDEPCKVINGHRLWPPILRDGTYPILPVVDEAFSQCTTTCSPPTKILRCSVFTPQTSWVRIRSIEGPM